MNFYILFMRLPLKTKVDEGGDMALQSRTFGGEVLD